MDILTSQIILFRRNGRVVYEADDVTADRHSSASHIVSSALEAIVLGLID